MAEVKTLGFWTIVALTITAMLGTGTFRGIKLAMFDAGAGTASFWTWVILAVVTIYVAFVFGELVSLFPKAGGTYEFAKRTYGRFPSFLVGWVTWLVANLTTSVLIVTAVDFIMPGQSGIVKILVSIGIIVLFNLITFFGVEASGIALNLFAVIALVLLFGLLFPGLFYVDASNLSGIVSGPPLLVFVAIFFIVETFFGWESASFLAEETKDAARVIPRALVVSTVIVGVIGVGLAFVTMGVFSSSELWASFNPALDLGRVIYGSAALGVLQWLVFLTLVGSAAGAVVSSPRLLLAMGRDRLFPDIFSHVHPKYKTPYKAIIFQTIVSVLVILLAFGRYTALLSMLVPMALMMYIFVIIAVPILRKKIPGKRTFRAPLGTVLPWIIAAGYLGVILGWLFTQQGSWSLFALILSFIAFGIPIYLLLSFFYDTEALRRISDRFAGLSLYFENFIVSPSLRKRILGFYRDLSGKTVVELGAGVGSLTVRLAESVGPKGRVFAIDMSPRSLGVLSRRLEKARVSNVVVIHDDFATTRIHPDVRHADFAYSVGYLGYVQNPKEYLKELADVMPEGSRICFAEFTGFFGFIPNKEWLEDDKEIKRVFASAGFSVAVQRIRSGAWTTVLVYGLRSRRPAVVV